MIVFAALLLTVSCVAALRVCGNFCGPGWCGATPIDETDCVSENYWQNAVDGSCIDQCCKVHDHCCGDGPVPACNRAIANCASSCSGPCADAVWAAMKFIDTFCCGSACPSSLIAKIETHLNRTIEPNWLRQVE